MNRIENFEIFYKQEILPILEGFKDIQTKERKKFFWGLIYGISAVFISFVLCFLTLILNTSDIDVIIAILNILTILLFYLGLIFFIITIAYLKNIRKDFVKLLKRTLFPKILDKFGRIQFYTEDSNINLITDDELKECEFFDLSSKYKPEADDQFEGEYKGIKYRVSEIMIPTKDSNFHDGSYIESGMFKGIIIATEFNKQIKGKTAIAAKGERVQLQPEIFGTFFITFVLCLCPFELFSDIITNSYYNIFIISLWLIADIIISTIAAVIVSNKLKSKKLNKVSLEDIDFHKKYDVYSQDQIEARYLITPSFMERFKNLKTAFNAKSIRCSFFNKNFMVLIGTNKNLFEVGSLFKSLDNYQNFKDFHDELNSIYDLIDHFKLDEKTGL